jgi:membrane protein involved in colicin uptake
MLVDQILEAYDHIMKRPAQALRIAFIALSICGSAQCQTPTATTASQMKSPNLSFDILSDTKGVQLNSYLRSLGSELKDRFVVAASAGLADSLPRQQEATLVLTIAPDGKLSSLQTETQDSRITRAAWQAAKGATYAAIPVGMRSSGLKFRVHFITD